MLQTYLVTKMLCMKRLIRLVKTTRFFNSGQVKASHVIGQWILHLVSLESVKVIVEVGSWNGRGSSLLICRAIERFSASLDKKVYGVEANSLQYTKARRFLQSFPYYELLFGSIVGADQLDTDNLLGNEVEWLRQDVSDLQSCPMVFHMLPTKIDLLILDGGEFSSYSEFQALRNSCRGWIILDDIGLRKNKMVFQNLLEDSSFTLIDSSSERNGIAVFKKKS